METYWVGVIVGLTIGIFGTFMVLGLLEAFKNNRLLEKYEKMEKQYNSAWQEKERLKEQNLKTEQNLLNLIRKNSLGGE